MSETFDPYREWLGIADPQRPPGLYVLLGLELFEADADRIEQAILKRMFAVSDHLHGPHSEWAERLLDQVQHAESWLTNTSRKAEYDALLRESHSPVPTHKHVERTIPTVVEEPPDAPIVLLEVAEQLQPEVAEEPAPPVVPPPRKATRAVPAISAAAIAERILRDDIKPQHVPQRAAGVKQTLPQRGPKPAPVHTPPHPVERFDSLKPMSKAPAAARSVKVSVDSQTLISEPLLSRVDIIAATNRTSPKHDPADEEQTLPDIDVSVLLGFASKFLNRYPKTISTIAGLVLASCLTYQLYPRLPLIAPRRPPMSSAEASSEDMRMAGKLLRVLHDPSQAIGARSAAAERMADLHPAVIHKFASDLEGLLDTEADEPTRQALEAALGKIEPP